MSIGLVGRKVGMGVQQVHVNIEEIRKPEIDAQLIADSIAQQQIGRAHV